jgi:hypothetical protein
MVGKKQKGQKEQKGKKDWNFAFFALFASLCVQTQEMDSVYESRHQAINSIFDLGVQDLEVQPRNRFTSQKRLWSLRFCVLQINIEDR